MWAAATRRLPPFLSSEGGCGVEHPVRRVTTETLTHATHSYDERLSTGRSVKPAARPRSTLMD